MALVLAALAFPARADFEANHRFETGELAVRNLVGEIRVQGHDGAAFEVRVNVQGRDASPERVHIEENRRGLTVVFPVEESKRFVYPRMGRHSKTSFSLSQDDSGWLNQVLSGLLGGRRITVAGRGRGLEIWADVEVRVPRGGALTVKHGVGEIRAERMEGDLVLDNSSGGVEIEGVQGAVHVDTGSGSVSVSEVVGSLLIDTGSGRVEAHRCEGDEIDIDTGSGRVVLESLAGGHVNVDTGSGSVQAHGIGADSATIDTGSGSVVLELDRMGSGRFEIDTGSGSVMLSLPAGASADVHASTGGGGIVLDLEGVTLRRKERDEVAFTIGGGGARVELDTGSGGIRITGAN
jgi:hypothetical protein